MANLERRLELSRAVAILQDLVETLLAAVNAICKHENYVLEHRKLEDDGPPPDLRDGCMEVDDPSIAVHHRERLRELNLRIWEARQEAELAVSRAVNALTAEVPFALAWFLKDEHPHVTALRESLTRLACVLNVPTSTESHREAVHRVYGLVKPIGNWIDVMTRGPAIEKVALQGTTAAIDSGAPANIAIPEVRLTPKYDAARRELTFAGKLVKVFKQPAKNQERILKAFEEEGWVCRIDDPLNGSRNETIRALNDNMKCGLIRFLADGSGEGIRWEHRSPLKSSKS